jgi:hypothetical protein
LVELCIHWLFYVVKTVMALCCFKWIWVLSLCVLFEGFNLFSLVGRLLLFIKVTMSACIQAAMGLLCMFSNCLLVDVSFQSHGHGFSHLVVGLFLWYWHQCISKVDYRVSIMPRCMLYDCW